MRDLLRFVLHWLSSAAVPVAAKLDVSMSASAVNHVALDASRVYTVTLSARTRD